MRSVEKHYSGIVNIAQLVLLSRDLTQNPLGSSTIPTPWEPAPASTSSWDTSDTKSVPSHCFSVVSEQLGSPPRMLYFLCQTC